MHSAIRHTPNLATSLLHVFKLKILLRYLVIRRTIVWGVKISQVYCKFFHKLTKKRKSHVSILVYRQLTKAELSHVQPRTQTKALIKQELTYCQECRSQCTKKAEWIKKVFISLLVYFHFDLWRIKLLKHALLSTYHIYTNLTSLIFSEPPYL